ncbi:unnamed protein product [Adineta ricciae]|uniref:ubiquitinyl hydrolase 1 n=1 Tax=Adineta ricciae TaxID=249248 RepID=A0A814RWS9_ADIRI|nr:unnamed protein product [Adineta ricciae]
MNVFPNKPLRLLKRRSQSNIFVKTKHCRAPHVYYKWIKFDYAVTECYTDSDSAFKSDSTPVGPRTTFKSATKPVESPVPVPRTKSTANEDEPTQYTPGICGLINIEQPFDRLYHCHSCTNYTQAKQKSMISSPLLSVLIIQLKRFPFDDTSQKINTFVRYKLQYKNLISTNDVYQLCAVSSHRRSLAGGHYIAFAKNYQTKQ